jgi:IS5 family transposase
MSDPQPVDFFGLVLNRADLAVQSKVRLPLPIVVGNADYAERESLLRRMDEILVLSGVEDDFLAQAVAAARTESECPNELLSDRRQGSVHRHAKQALRCTMARILSNECHRQFSTHLAESPLLQWFCGCDSLKEKIRVPSKSTLQRMESEVPPETITKLNDLLLKSASGRDAAGVSPIGLVEAVDLSVIWIDSTCAKLDIHYPADWALLRDGTRSIMRAIQVIREHGLKHRMPAPESFVSEMNKQAMAMTGASRRGRGGDKKRGRKRALRAMKRVVRKVQRHGRRYAELIRNSWAETDLSKLQATRIAERIEGLLAAMPAAIKQAHERIIGERLVPQEDKILSLYEPHAKVYVRGKAGADVEFGLQLLVSESADGLIVDCHLVPDRIANDSTLLMPAIARMNETFGPTVPSTVVTDRGFASKANSASLTDADIIDATLPRTPADMQKKLENPVFRKLQRRRAQTEARIGILKANFLGDRIPTKGPLAQRRFVAWATLAHNVWVLARLDRIPVAIRQAS